VRCLCLTALALAPGCLTPRADFACGGGPLLPESRPGVLARQLLTDTAVEATHHPVRDARALLSESADFLHALRHDIAGKHFACCYPSPGPVVPCAWESDPLALEADLQALTRKDLQPADVCLYPDGVEALAAVEALIDRAACRLDVLMFLWDNDPLGWEVARHLAARACPGCPVRVLVDGGGNLIFGLPETAPVADVNRVVCWLARQPYVEVRRTRNPCARYDHRKLVVADGRAAWTGGRNFTRASFFGQHDLSFTIEGPLAEELADTFERFWHEQGGGDSPRALPFAGDCPPPEPNAWARLVYTEPDSHELADTLSRAVDDARRYVFAENVYFSDGRIIAQLIEARRRGADVRVVLTVESNSELFNRVNRVTADRLLREGCRVYLYPGMTHVKALAVDGVWAYTGTANFDPLSMRHDHELGLAVSAGPVIAELEQRIFLADFRPEWELHEPLPLSAGDRAAELLASLFL
jgi:cardiolipin synthase